MKRLLAFGACSTIAGLLLLRLLPELAAGPERDAEPEKPPIRIELSAAGAPAEAPPDRAVPLLLPPPPPMPTPKVASPSKAEQVAKAPEPLSTPPAPIAEAAPPPKPRPKPQPVTKQTQTAAAPVIREETQRNPSPQRGSVAPTPHPDSAAPTETYFVAPGPLVEADGRVLLRILEHGAGPEIEIAWPVSDLQRRALYRLFEACYGMEIALIDAGGRLFSRAGESGQPWQPNMDRYSGFVRQPAGRLTREEQDSIAGIRAFHGGLRGLRGLRGPSGLRAAANVRLFPRRLDALLLGGLKALIGDGYASASAIRAHYRRDGDSVLVEAIRLDGRPILGRIDLSPAARHCRAGAWS